MSELHETIKEKWTELSGLLDEMVEADCRNGKLNESQEVIDHLHREINHKHQAITIAEHTKEYDHDHQDQN